MTIYEEIAKSTKCVGVVAPRGKGKSWLLQLIAEIAVWDGTWHALVFDTKGDDALVDTPAFGWQARRLKAFGLEPRGWNSRFMTFNFPYGLITLPLKYELVPIAIRMVGFGHLKHLKSVLAKTDWRLLEDAYFDAGGPKAKLEDMIKRLMINRGNKLSRTLLALITSGYFDNESPLEPSNLLEDTSRRQFTVIGTNWFESTVTELAWFGIMVLVDSLTYYLKASWSPHQVLVIFRELGAISARTGREGAAWHMGEKVANFIKVARAVGVSNTKIYWEAQSTKDVDPRILENTDILIAHVTALKQKRMRRDVEEYFPLEPKLMQTIEPMLDTEPGRGFFLIRKDSSWDRLDNIPPPFSARFRELVADPKELRREVSKLRELLPLADTEILLQEALERFKWWKSQIPEIQEELFFKPDVVRITKFTKPIALLLVAVRRIIDKNLGKSHIGQLNIHREAIIDEIYKLTGMNPKGPAKYLTPYYLERTLRNQKNRDLITAFGMRIGRASDGDLVFGVIIDSFDRAWNVYGEMAIRYSGLAREVIVS